MTPANTHEEIYDFANGVPGFPELKSFYIKDLKDGSYPPLKIMVSVENPDISFILYPHGKENSLFDQQTMCGFAKAYNRPETSVDIYSIVTIRKPAGIIHLTTNLQAPIVLDRADHTGWQHIAPSKYADLAFPLDQLSQSFQGNRFRA